MKTFLFLIFTMFALLSFAQKQDYYADESEPPIRTDTIPALILYFTEYAPHVQNSHAGHTLIINYGYIVFDVYATGDGDLTYDANGNVTFMPIERRKLIQVLMFDYTCFPDNFEFFDYRIIAEFE